jgi:hypothetical protein
MKSPRIIISLTGIALLNIMFGCNDLGVQLARILPENDGPHIGTEQLSQSGDATAIDQSEIGGGNSSMAHATPADSTDMGGFSEASMDGDYLELVNDLDSDMGMDENSSDGSFMGFGEYSQSMQLEDLSDGYENGGPQSTPGAQSGMFTLPGVPTNDGTFGYMENYGGEGPMLEPQLGNYGGEQSLGGFGGGGAEKPTDDSVPRKPKPPKGVGNGKNNSPSSNGGIPNIRDRSNKRTGNNPAGTSDNPQIPSMGSATQNPGSGNSTSSSNPPMVRIRMPGNVTNPVYNLVNTVAVPILLQNNTAMSFSSEMLQQRDLTSRGTVYWVVHSQRLGFSRFAVPRVGGRVNGVVAKFTPTSGPFKAFIVTVEPDGKVKYLSSAVDIKWNP